MLAYDQVQETYRQKFRGLTKSHGNTFVEFADELVRLFDQWLKSAGVVDYLSLKNFMLLDQFKCKISPELRVYLEEKEIKDLKRAARLSDTYFLTQKCHVSKGGGTNVKVF